MTSKEDISRLKQHIDFLYFKANFVDKKPIERTKATIESIEQDLEKLEKLEKVVETLKRTSVNPLRIKFAKDYQDFQKNIVYEYERMLTEQEFDLLKEVFGNE